ncbi:AMP-binding protein [Rhodocyclus tenuis]|uniref:class I adenylate-forming enzyme family protein n=1 Tax=Rhodocyclus gracilis TaxID=2929842 RepID=UPI001298E474|nr:AMP-binding protein [Rhodocyclus gracilis]MRD71759.1 AMP-binding protein [Rhodocyclus gracilis]
MTRLATLLTDRAARTPQAVAVRTAQGDFSYAQLYQQATRDARTLMNDESHADALADTAPNALTVITAFAGGAWDLLRAAFACSFAGTALAPLDPANAERRWQALAELGGRHIRRRTLPPSGAAQVVPCPHDNAEPQPNALPAPPPTRHDAPALIIATSGSEGAPKAVMLSHANLAAAAGAANARLPLAVGDVWLDCLPLYHIGGMSILHRCLHAGATISLHERFDAATVWEDIASGTVSHVSLTPAMLSRLLDLPHSDAGGDSAGASPRPPASLRYALIGGAALSRPLYERARAAGWPLCPSWGMSESAAQAATLVASDTPWQEGDVGTLLPGLDSRCDDSGRLHLRGKQIMLGYLTPTLAPGVGLTDGWFATSDLGQINAAGRLRIVGRADDMLISGGVNVHPLDVESQLAACPGIRDIAVTAIADPVWGDLLVAVFVGDASPESVREFGRQQLPTAQRPRRVLRVAQLPRNAMGKIERAALRALAQEAT